MSEQYPDIDTEVTSPSHYVEVLGSKMHYIAQGEGEPILFVHGIPTSAYLWRNVIPQVADLGRCIAVDLIGMGKSDKPDIEYSVFDHCRYLAAFIEALNLKNVTLVLHAWGSVIGFDYAMRYESNIKALAFVEAHIRPAVSWEMVSLPVQELTSLLELPDGGYDVVMNSNYFVNKVLPNGVLRQLSKAELDHYLAPFSQPGSCKPLWQYLQDLPLGNEKTAVVDLISDYSTRLIKSSVPKLMMYAIPGFITTVDTIQWARDNLKELSSVDIGDGLHYPQESNPQRISSELANWYAKLY